MPAHAPFRARRESRRSRSPLAALAFLTCLALSFAGPALAQLSGTYTLGAGGDYATFADALTALANQSVGGPVTFEVLSGIYPEQVVIPNIPGASGANRIVFRSQSGNAADVTVQYAATLGFDAPVVFQGASFVSFENMTIQVTPSAGEPALLINGPTNGDRVTGCVLTSTDPLDWSGIYVLGDMTGLEIRGNTIASGGYVYLQGGNYDAVQFVGNRLAESSLYVIPGTGPVGSSSLLLANNFLADCDLEVYFNGTAPGLTEISYNTIRSTKNGLSINSFGSPFTPGTFYVRNNIIDDSGAGTYAYLVEDAGVIAVSDHNDILATGGASFAGWSGNIANTLGELQALGGMDAHSVSADPGFVSATDLHATSASLNGAGTPLASVTVDIDGEPRDAATPDIGADEFAPNGTLSGTYGIGAGLAYATIGAAVADLAAHGVAGPVTFDIAPGTYSERIVFSGAIPGASAVNRILFRSQTQHAPDVNVQASTGTDLGVLDIADADYVTFSDLNLQSTVASDGPVVRFSGFVQGDRLLNCGIAGAPGQGIGLLLAQNATAESLEVSRCSIYQVGTGVVAQYVALTGVRFVRNSFSGSAGGALLLFGWSGPASGAFQFANNVVFDSPITITSSANANGLEIAFNTVVMWGPTSPALYLGGSGAPAGSVRIVNNIFWSPGGGALMSVNDPSAVAMSDYNLLQTSGATLALWSGSAVTSLASLRAANGMDQHSVGFDPGLNSQFDTHTNLGALAHAGTPVAGLADDWDGDPRDPVAPSIGADEITHPLPPLSGAFTVGSGGDYADLSTVLAELGRHGLGGPVQLDLLPGTYTGQVVVSPVAGATAASRLTLRSQTGNAADVTLRYSTSSSGQGVVELVRVEHVTLSRLTVTVSEAQGRGTGIRIVGSALGSQVLDCAITGLQASGYGIASSSNASVDSLELRGNSILQSGRGVYFATATLTGVRVTGNTLRNAAAAGIAIDAWAGAATGAVLVANNFLESASLSMTQGASSRGLDLFHNSVNVTGTGDALVLSASGSPPANSVRIHNNIFACPGGGRACLVQAPLAAAESDHNDLYTTGTTLALVGGTGYGSLPALQSATGREAGSVSTLPLFVSATDLHTSLAALDGRGVPLASVTDDIDGDSRSATAPDLGADEFTAVPGLAGTYTIGSGGTYATFAAALADLATRGVVAPAVFDVLPGSYTGQVTIPSIPGTSPVNTVTFRSQAGNAASDTLQFATASFTQGVVELSSASYVTLSALTLRVANGTGSGSGIRISGSSSGTRVLDCVFTGLSTNGNGIYAPSAACDGLEIRGNTIAQSNNGIVLDNCTLTGARVVRNTIGTAATDGILLNGWTGPASGSGILVANNVLQNARLRIVQSTASAGCEVAHNSISYAGSVNALLLAATGFPAVSTLRVVNNVVAATAGAPALALGGGVPVALSDYNAWSTTGPNLYTINGVGSPNLAALQAATGRDAHSLELYPGFLDATLHTRLPMLDGAGMPLASVTEDFDGEPRDAGAPDLGADEFTNPFAPLAGTYTAGAGGDYATPAAALAALLTHGVGGPVTFNVLPGTYAGQLTLFTPAGASPANRVTFRSASGNAADATVSYAPPSGAFGTVQFNGADYCTFSDLSIQITPTLAGGYGVQFMGGTTGSQVVRCAIGGMGAGGIGVYFPGGARADTVEVRGSTIGQSNRGIYSSGSTLIGVRFVGNSIRDAAQSGIQIDSWTGPATGSFLVANNMLLNAPLLFGRNTNSAGADVFHNTVYVSSSSVDALNLTNSFATPVNVFRIRNNVFACPGGGRALVAAAPGAILECDNNDLYSTGTILTTFGTTSYATLAAHQAATGRDLASVSCHPGVLSASNLHTTLAALDGLGTPLASVTDDFDGEPRNASAPDLGADEFTPVLALAGAYTIGPGGNYASFAAATADLLRKGVAAPVTFAVLNGTYTERVFLETPGGASSANRVTFQSQSGFATGDTLQFATASTNEGVVELLGADWVGFRNMTIRVSSANGLGSGVRVTGSSSGAFVSGCTLTGLGANGFGVSVPSASAETLEVRGNVVDTGSRALSFDSSALTGVRVLGNRVGSGVAVGLYLRGWSGPASGSVLVANNFFATPVQIRTTGTTSVGADFYHNNVSITSGTSDAVTLIIDSGSAPTNAVRVKNNALAALSGGRALAVSNPSLLAESDYNDLFTSGAVLAGINTTLYNRLADLQASGRDAHSISVFPGFVSVTGDLHTRLAYLDGLGTALASVTDDVDGEPRSATAPDIGADESVALTPLAGDYAIGAGGTYANGTAALADLYQRGVSAPVSLSFLPGTFSGPYLLQTPPGASPANRVTFRSLSGNPADVTIPYSTATTSSGVFELRGADYLTLLGLTLQVTQASGQGTGVLVTGRSTSSQVVDCRFTGLGAAGNGVRLLAPATVESLEVRGCSTTTGAYGFLADAGAALTGARIVRNTFNTTGTSGNTILLQSWTGPATGALLVANNFLTGRGPSFAQNAASGGLDFLDNSVSVNNAADALTIGVSGGTPPAGSVRVKNNVLSNAGTGRAYFVANAAAIGESDYNDLYKSAAGVLASWVGNGYSTLATLQAASGKDVHSVSGNPLFASATDLHSSAAVLDNVGTPIAAVPDDIDGEPRSATTPDIGADEFGAAEGVPPVVAFTAGPADGAVLLGDSTSYAWSGTDNVSPPAALVFRSALDGPLAGAYSAATTRMLVGLTDGAHAFQVEAKDEAGNVSAPATRQLRVHRAAPDVVFDSPASSAYTGNAVTVAWHLTAHSAVFVPESTFYEYRLDGGPFSAPSRDSSVALTGLAEGAHAVDVRVTDNAGLTATRSRGFTVDVTAPVVTIAGGPAEGGYSTAAASFTLSATDNLTVAGQVRFSRSLDGGAFTVPATGATLTLTGLAPGAHTLVVRALDLAGNTSADVTRHWTVDTAAPETQIVGGPAPGAVLTTGSVTFDYSGSDDLTPPALLLFQSRLDGAGFSAAAAATSRSFTGVADGAHTFEVRAVDLAGNADGSPASRTFTVDALGPVVTITSGPANNACVASAGVSFGWSATDAVTPVPQIEFSYRLDAAPFSAFDATTSAPFDALAEGLHTFTLQARDGSGNVTTTSRTFRVDVTAPVAAAPTTRVLDSSRIRIQCTATDNSGATGFRVQVTTDPAFGSTVADVQVGAAGTYDFTGVPGSSYYARSQATDCAGNLSAFTGPSNVAILASLPNLVVSSVTAPPAVTSGQSITVDYTVANTGAGPTSTPSWYERVYLSPTPVFDAGTAVPLGDRTNVTFLAVGESYTGSITGTVPIGTSGPRYVLVTADAGGAVPETDGGDNTRASSPVAVTLGAFADLVVTQVVAPPTALSGDSVTVTWTVRNDGTGRTDVSSWSDAVFLSTDAVFDFTVLGGGNIRATDDWLGRLPHTGALEPDSSYTASLRVPLPEYFGGARYLIVAADMGATGDNQAVSDRGAVFEDQHELNATAAESTEVTQQLPPDLVVDAVTSPGTAVSGGALQVTFTIGNHGFNATGPSNAWSDQVYLSADPVLDGSDLLMGTYPHTGVVELQGTYSSTVSLAIPRGTSGPRYVIVKADGYGQLAEYLENNNSGLRAQAVTVTLAPWPNLVPSAAALSDTVVAGGTGTVRWLVTDRGSVSAVGTWTDRIDLGAGPAWTSSARASGSLRSARVLDTDDSYEASTTFDVPASYSGTYYVFVRTDAQNELFENTDEGDNTALVGSVYVKPYPAIDLAVLNPGAPASATGGQPLPVTFTVRNDGAGTTLASWWTEDVWLSSDLAFDAAQDLQIAAPGHAGALAAGASYTRTVNGAVPPGLNGTYHVLVRTDPGGGSGDGNLANNTVASAGTVTVTSPLPPQLTVSNVTVAANLDAGQPATVSWQLGNTGAGAVPNAEWYTGVYLSQDPWLDGGDIALGSLPGPAAFAGGASVPQQLSVPMPVWASGAYYVIVRTDNRGEVFEGSGEGDNLASAPTTLTLPPPSDLVVTDVVVPPAAVPGEPITVSYTLANQGVNPAVGQLQNAVYMSADGAFASERDPLVGVEAVSINLPPGTSQRITQRTSARPLQVDLEGNVTGLLPALSPGPYHAIVRANIRANIREQDGDNNTTVSPGTVQTDLAALTLGAPAPFALANGQARFYKVTVPADFDLELQLSSSVPDATNEMFVAFGRTPDENEYDFTSPPGFTANPSVLVPQTQAGTYYVMVVSRGLGQVASSENLTLLAEVLPFSLQGISPASGGAGGVVTVHVRGAGLRDTTRFQLQRAATLVQGKVTRFTNSTDLLVRFDLAGLTLGEGNEFDFVAANGAGSVTLPNAFVLEQPRPLAVTIETDNADVLRRSATAPFTVRFRNTSNQDVPVVQARVLFPATSQLRTLETGPGLFRTSQLVPGIAPVSGDVAILHRSDGSDSLAAVDVVGANLAPGEVRTLTLGVSGFASSPYSLRVLATGMPLREFLDRQQARFEAARRTLLADPSGLPADLVQLAGDAFTFRDSALVRTYADAGMLLGSDVEDYLFAIDHFVLPSPAYPQPAGPQALLDELAQGGPCGGAGAVPECSPDVAVPGTALPACASVFGCGDLPVPLAVGGGVVARVAGTTAAGFTATASADARVVVPCDPNLLTGPAGFGTEKWVRPVAMPYRVDFENLPGVASAPAQVVRVSVPIDPNLDLTTFRVGSMGFGGTHQINVPGGRTSYSSQTFYSDLNLSVRVTVGIDLAARAVNWVFTTIDPATGQQPTDPFRGFLPVNDVFGSGTGFVTYSIQPYATAVSGSTLQAQASIRFDSNNPVPTNLARNRVDTREPLSAALTGIEVLDPTRVRVHWVGADDSTGAGLAGVTLYVRQDAGAFTPVAPAVAGTSLEVPVADGHKYEFYTLASDNVGNAEAPKTGPDPGATLTLGTPQLGVDGGRPRVTMLHPNFPNPFHGKTTVRFDLARDETVTLDVFDVQGRLVARPLDGKRLEAGTHSLELAPSVRGAGVYFYRLRAGDYEKTHRMVLIP